MVCLFALVFALVPTVQQAQPDITGSERVAAIEREVREARGWKARPAE